MACKPDERGFGHTWLGNDSGIAGYHAPDERCECGAMTWGKPGKPAQLTFDYLKDSFVVPKPGKTLKLKVKDVTPAVDAFLQACEYLRRNSDGYTRVEFKLGRQYVVIANLG
jgi:hypothetical protein